MDEASRQKLFHFIYEALDEENSADMETFAQNFYNNGEVWDLIADHFPDAKSGEVRQAMMEAFGLWQKGQGEGEEGGSVH